MPAACLHNVEYYLQGDDIINLSFINGGIHSSELVAFYYRIRYTGGECFLALGFALPHVPYSFIHPLKGRTAP